MNNNFNNKNNIDNLSENDTAYYVYPPMQNEPKKKKSNKKPILTVLTVIMCFVVSFCGGYLGNSLSQYHQDQDTIIDTENNTSSENDSNISDGSSIIKTSNDDSTAMSISEVAAQTVDSVVEITTEQLTTGNTMKQYVSTGAGSGVIISNDGYIVTNNHVIDGASKITVTLRNSTQYPATLVGTDSKTDIAVIKIDTEGLTPATFGDSSELTVGEDAIVIGNPLGQLGGTVTSGIISALDREITIDGEVMNLLQTNAAVNPGNSGGALFNNKAELVGIINAKSSGSDVEGLGFAIPSNVAKPVIEDLINYGYVNGRVELGVTFLDIDSNLTAMMYRVDTLGVYVYSVKDDTNAKKAGLSSGDRVISVGEEKVNTTTDITSALNHYKAGDSVTFVVSRNGKEVSVTFVLEQQYKSSNI